MPKNAGHGQSSVLTDRECSKLLSIVTNPKHRLLLVIAKFTGERFGAIIQLRVADVYANIERGELRAAICFRASTRKASPKGKRNTREVPLSNQDFRKELQAYRPLQDSEWLFPNYRCPEKHMTFQNAYNFLMEAVDEAGLADRGISTHSFRRTLASRLSELGVGLATIQQIIGHKRVETTRRYVDVSDRQISEELRLI